MNDAQRRKLDAHLDELRCVPVYLSGVEVSRYYDGFSNAVLWPLFHYLLDRIPPHSQEWEVYRAVNEKFADAIARVWRPGDLRLDPRLPALARARGCSARASHGATIGFFLHIPFPASEVLRILPWREQILEGMLGADLDRVSHVHVSKPLRLVGPAHPRDLDPRRPRSSSTGARSGSGSSRSASTRRPSASSPKIRRCSRKSASIRADARGQRILLGIDRLDYTKGIPRRLLRSSDSSSRSLTGAARCGSCRLPSPRATRSRATRSFVGR